MEQNVMIYHGQPRVGTKSIAEAIGNEHRVMKRLIYKYQDKFATFGTLKVQKVRSTGGRPSEEFFLNEDQFLFLCTLLKNNSVVVELKHRIITQFKKCREELRALKTHKEQPEYLPTRNGGKIVRLKATDTMKEFIEYAKSQGSKNADKYYMAITKMLNKLLFIVQGKHKNLREVLTIQQLMTVSSAEQIVIKGLEEGMKKKMYYKDIYKLVKERVKIFAELHGQSKVIAELPDDPEPLEA